MRTPRSSLWLLAVGLIAGFFAGYFFQSVTKVSEVTRPRPFTESSATGLSQANLGTPTSGQARVVADATAWAVSLANDAAQAAYGTARFTTKGEAASFDGRRWTWKQRVACGRGDLEAEVWLSSNGMVEKLDVQLLIYESARDF